MDLVFSFQPCKKDEPTNTELLTIEEGWTIENIDADTKEIADAFIALYFQILPPEMQTPETEAGLRASLESLTEIEACEKDDITIFKTNGNIFEDYGNLPCDDPELTVVNTWTFNGDETKLIITDNQEGEVQNIDIVTLNESTLIGELRMVPAEGMDEEELAELEGLEGYEDFISKDLVITFTYKAN